MDYAMKRWMRILASTALTCSMLATMLPMGALAAETDSTVSISEAAVLKHGRTYEKNGTLCLDWSNSGVTFNFNGTGAKMEMAGSSANPNPAYVNVYVDGSLVPTSTLQVGTTKTNYVLAEGLESGDHTISVRKRNEAVYGGSATLTLSSITIVDGALTAAPAASDRHIEVIGDSITAGFGNLAANTNVGYSSHVSDGTSTYATLTAQALGAEIDVIARSGIRFVRADMNNSMYPVYEQISGLSDKCTDAYDFASNPKDVVIINLGTNDNGATLDGQPVTDEYVQSETKAFLELVRKNNPNAEIVWAYGIMGSGRTDAIQAAIKELNDAGDNHISFFALDRINSVREGYGTGSHPTVVTAINRSFDLTEYIAEKMGWNDYQYSAQLAQQLRVAENYDADYLKPYTTDSIQALSEAINAGKALDKTASNEVIKNAVSAIQTAHMNLAVDMNEVATISADEKSATSHYMEVTYSTDTDLTASLGHKMYLTYEATVETTKQPTTKTWLSYVRNGRAFLTGKDGKEVEIVNGLSFGNEPMNQADTQWVTNTIEIPDSALESGGITRFRMFYYNDTGNMSASEKDGIDWSNDNGVTIKIRNIKVLATVAEFVNKDSLKAALDEQKSDAELAAYTDESVAAYKKLFEDALAVYNNPNVTQLEINAATTSLKTADALLKLRDENTLVIFLADEKTSNEDHYLSVDQALTEAFDLTPYANEELVFSYDIRINTTENHPDTTAVGWMNGIRNGAMRLFSVPASQAGNDNAIVAGGDANGQVHCGKDELANIQPNEWLSVTVPVPQAIRDAGQVTKFHMFIYNDLNSIDPTWANNQGVTLSLRNVKIAKVGGSNPDPVADKTALNAAITAAEALTEEALAAYTEESVATFKSALASAKAVAANAAATQTEVDNAKNTLTAAQEDLTEKPEPAIVYGDLTGDGVVMAEDALKALQAATGKISLTDEEKAAGNVDDDEKGEVTANDALLILQYATKKISSFPVEKTDPTPGPDPTPVVDKTQLTAAINAAKAITDLSVYTDASAQDFRDALAQAETVANKTDATQEEIDAAKTALETAQNELTLKPTPGPDPIDPDDEGLGSGDGAEDTLQ